MSHVIKKGPWTEERMLGSGGFGAVHLWSNEETGEKIALKRCRLKNEMTLKHRQRWQLEVQIMQRLEHENVIAARLVPEPLDVKPNELPLLAMEYCSGGDLRRVLNEAQNCCGLKEFSVRCLVQDVASAIEYLHGKRIIHRDLKPENIVLKPVDDKIVYKIIDLGYAKELDMGSVCTSFVGTLQYLAPELYSSQKYTCTVDYWSFGTVVYECITGSRPFLPNHTPVQWHKEVAKKSPEDISAKQDAQGEVTFSKTLPQTSRLCRTMQTYMEQWLRVMLRWDSTHRGGGLLANNRPNCFGMLERILQLKVIYMLHVATNELYSYPVLDKHTMMNVQERITEDINIPLEQQDILLPTGISPDHDKPASQCWLEPSEQNFYVFLFTHGGEDCKPDNPMRKIAPLPNRVQAIVRDSKTMIPFSDQKRAWAESVVYCEQQYLEYKRMVLSQRAAMLSLLRKDSVFVNTKNKMNNEFDQLTATINYFLQSLDHDMMFYSEQAKNGGVTSEQMLAKWTKMKEEVEGYKTVKHKVDDILSKTFIVQTKISELQKSPFARTKTDDTMEELSKQARQVYQEFRQTLKENRDVRDQKPMVTVVVKCAMWRDKKMPDLYAHLGKICSRKAEISNLLPKTEELLQEILKCSQKLINYQKQRQSAIWQLVEVANHQNNRQPQFKQQQPQSNDELDNLGFCRQEVPTTIPALPSNQTMLPNNHTSSIMQSMLSSTTAMESLAIVEDSKVTSRMFEEAMSNMMVEHDQYASLVTTLDTSLGSGTGS